MSARDAFYEKIDNLTDKKDAINFLEELSGSLSSLPVEIDWIDNYISAISGFLED